MLNKLYFISILLIFSTKILGMEFQTQDLEELRLALNCEHQTLLAMQECSSPENKHDHALLVRTVTNRAIKFMLQFPASKKLFPHIYQDITNLLFYKAELIQSAESLYTAQDVFEFEQECTIFSDSARKAGISTTAITRIANLRKSIIDRSAAILYSEGRYVQVISFKLHGKEQRKLEILSSSLTPLAISPGCI